MAEGVAIENGKLVAIGHGWQNGNAPLGNLKTEWDFGLFPTLFGI